MILPHQTKPGRHVFLLLWMERIGWAFTYGQTCHVDGMTDRHI